MQLLNINVLSIFLSLGSYHQDADETGESLLKLMTDMEIGVWPIIDSLYDTSKFSLERALANLVLLDVPVVFKMEIVPDERLTNSYLIKVSKAPIRSDIFSSKQYLSQIFFSDFSKRKIVFKIPKVVKFFFS